MGMVSRFDVFYVALDPSIGSEYRKTRPCVVVSPDQLNRKLTTVIVAPMTTVQKPYLMRVKTVFKNKPGDIAVDQLRVVDKSRLQQKLGRIDDSTQRNVIQTLIEMFS